MDQRFLKELTRDAEREDGMRVVFHCKSGMTRSVVFDERDAGAGRPVVLAFVLYLDLVFRQASASVAVTACPLECLCVSARILALLEFPLAPGPHCFEFGLV